jgi:hypothetical protein
MQEQDRDSATSLAQERPYAACSACVEERELFDRNEQRNSAGVARPTSAETDKTPGLHVLGKAVLRTNRLKSPAFMVSGTSWQRLNSRACGSGGTRFEKTSDKQPDT